MNKAYALLLAFPLLYLIARAADRSNVVQASQPKVVKIGIVTTHGRWVGSGAFISRDGSILTCAHLFGRPGKVFVKTASGQTYLAHVVRVDHKVDLAVIKIDVPSAVPYFQLGPEPNIGQPVIAFGSPLNLQGTVSFGYVENIAEGYVIQGCPTNPGNSGGPLVDYQGRLIGVNVAVLLLNPFQTAQGMGLAVPLGAIRQFVRI